jgi:hypothetical protein
MLGKLFKTLVQHSKREQHSEASSYRFLKIYEAESSTAKLVDTGKHAFSIQEINPAELFAAGAKRYGRPLHFESQEHDVCKDCKVLENL